MVSSRQSLTLLLCGILLAGGCSSAHEAELAKARAELEAARADAEKARVEAEAAKAALPKPPKTPPGLRIWRDPDVDQLCSLAGIDAYCFRFEGPLFSCWLECDVDGKKTKAIPFVDGSPPGRYSGSFVLLRHTENKQEVWSYLYDYRRITGDRDSEVPKRVGITITNDRMVGTPSFRDFIPQPGSVSKPRLVRAKPEISEISLKEGQEGTLATLLSIGEKDGETTRSVKLQCKAAKE